MNEKMKDAAPSDPEVLQIKRDWARSVEGAKLIAIEERADGWVVHQHTADSVFPPVLYPNKRLAAARVLQLLHIGPVAPQSHPESVCIETVELDSPAASPPPLT